MVISLTLAIEPTYRSAQYVYDDLPADAIDGHFEEIFGRGYSVSLFTDWRGGTFNQVWVKRRDLGRRTGQRRNRRWLGAPAGRRPRHPVPGMSPVHCTEQLGVPGPWHERLPHFRLDFTPSAGRELQSEFMLPRTRAVEAIRAVEAVSDRRRAGRADLGGAHDRGRRAVAQPVLPARLGRPALHLDR